MTYSRFAGSFLISLGILVMPVTMMAATYTWDGGGADNNWSTADNWNPNYVPGSTGSVIFDATSTDDMTIDSNIRIHSLVIDSGYTGTITQSGAIMVGTGGLVQEGGAFEGAAAHILLQNHLTLSGGTFQSTSGILSISGSFLHTGGTFDHNDGTVSLASPSNRTLNTDTAFNRLNIESTKEAGLVGYWKLDETSIPTRTCEASGSVRMYI